MKSDRNGSNRIRIRNTDIILNSRGHIFSNLPPPPREGGQKYELLVGWGKNMYFFKKIIRGKRLKQGKGDIFYYT